MIGTGSGRFPGTGRAFWMNSTGNLETPASSKASCSECRCHWVLRLKRRIRHSVCWPWNVSWGPQWNFHELSRSKMIQVLVSVSSVVVDQLGAGIQRIDQGVKGIDLELWSQERFQKKYDMDGQVLHSCIIRMYIYIYTFILHTPRKSRILKITRLLEWNAGFWWFEISANYNKGVLRGILIYTPPKPPSFPPRGLFNLFAVINMPFELSNIRIAGLSVKTTWVIHMW